MKTRTVVIVVVSILLMAGFTQAGVISIDFVANGSAAVSGDVTGGLTGQTGLWNALPLDGAQSLSNLKDGDQVDTAFGFALSGVDHVQVGGSPFNPGVILPGDNPERPWCTGGEDGYTMTFTGLLADTEFDLVVFGTGDPRMVYNINGGSDIAPPATPYSTKQMSNSSGEIVILVTCGGDTYANYGEVAGAQLGGASIPEPATMALLAFGGLAILRRRNRR